MTSGKGDKQAIASRTRGSTEDANKHGPSKEPKDMTKIEQKRTQDCSTQWDDPEHMEQNQQEYKKFQDSSRKAEGKAQSAVEDDPQTDESSGKKRGHGSHAVGSNKKQKRNGGKHDEPSGAAGDKTRVPKKGQKVQWKSLPGYVDGEVVEILYGEKKVEGKNVKASKEDPRVILKSDASGKICVHKPEVVYFD